MSRQRASDPPRPASSVYPTSPTASRTTRASSIFPYSTARPPTNYSQQSFLQDRDAPPVPRPQSVGNSPFGGIVEEEDDEGETPLYARSDWDASTVRSPRTGGGGSTAWSRSSFAGMTTAPLTTARGNTTLGGIREEAEEDVDDYLPEPYTAQSQSQDQVAVLAAGYTEGLTMSPGIMSAVPRTPLTPYTVTSATGLRHDPNYAKQHHRRSSSLGRRYSGSDSSRSSIPSSRTFSSQGSRYEGARKSTLPSVLDLEYLTRPKEVTQQQQTHSQVQFQAGSFNPFADSANSRNQRNLPKINPNSSPNQASPNQEFSPDLLTPTAHNRLGRMSVAPARYTPEQPSSPTKRTRFDEKELPTLIPNPVNAVKTVVRSGLILTYLTWRPFVIPGLALCSALLLTISLQNNPGAVSRYLAVKEGVFNVSPANSNDVGLGVGDWCQLKGGSCEAYRDGDFTNAGGKYTLPGDPLLTALGDMLTALTAFSWLHALYLLITAFLHFYLFFALSLPFDHLVFPSTSDSKATNDNPEKPNMDQEDRPEQKEVDIRVRCERPPFEGYIWVWWAWWGHRKAPLGPIFAVIVTVLAASSFAIAFMFKRSVIAATSSEGVSLGPGGYIPLVALLSTLDPFINAIKYFITFPSSWSTFLHPPSPSPAAIFLPPTQNPMKHVRNPSGESFFAPRRTLATHFDARTARLTTAPPAPGAELDEETKRWLAGYPADPELVPLIAALRGGIPNDDFILSEVGLLYLRPEMDEPALLVPPSGPIRRELLEDAHHEPDISGNSSHLDYQGMMEIVNGTFWWNGMENDVRGYLTGCAGCKLHMQEGVGATELDEEREMRTVEGMEAPETLAPYTGVTGWTNDMKTAGAYGGHRDGSESAMAAEMAFAMQKADEQAAQDQLGLR